jgi:hypothetical protein
MADNNDPKTQQLSAAFSNRNSETTSSGLQTCAVQNPKFDMTAFLSAAQTYTKLNGALNKMIGMEVRWFRSVPQQRSKDVIFQTYTLHNVEDDPVCIKVVPGAQGFPDSKYSYDLAGLEYEIPLEVYIDKTYWEETAGYGTAPQEKDIVYFAVPNKLFEVASSYLWRGFAEQETTWKCNLKKHTPSADRKIGPNLAQTMNDYTVSSEEIFGDAMDADVAKITNDKQFNQFNSTEKDKYKTIDASVKTFPYSLNIYGTVVTQSLYDLSASGRDTAVTYAYGDHIHSTDNRCVTAWSMINPDKSQVYEVDSIAATTDSSSNYKIKLKSRFKTFSAGDTFVISRPGSLSFYAEVIDCSTTDSKYYVRVDDAVIDYLASIKSDWISAKGYTMKVQPPLNIIDGINEETHGFKVDVYANQYIKITYGAQEHIAVMTDKLLDNEWYGFIVNIGNYWNQYNVYVYEKHPSDETAKLQIKYYDTMDFVPEETVIDSYSIKGSPAYVTNIRLYNVTIEEEKQIKELLTYFVSDGDQLIIGDNADGKFTAPYIGKQR